jgi:hypothetical protein
MNLKYDMCRTWNGFAATKLQFDRYLIRMPLNAFLITALNLIFGKAITDGTTQTPLVIILRYRH